jgi:S1-C subfamily serine protease
MAMRAPPGMGPGGPVPGQEIRRFEFRGPPGAFDDGTRFAGMEFATLSERLGSYFGVKSGVLVVRAGPADGPWKLQDGDVILSIDGRTPTSAAHAGRILRSYTPGEKVKLRVQRDRRAQDIEVAATGGVRDFRLERIPSAEAAR